MSPKPAPSALLAAFLLATPIGVGCASLDRFFFDPEPVDEDYVLSECPIDLEEEPPVGNAIPAEAIDSLVVQIDTNDGLKRIDGRFVSVGPGAVTILYNHGKSRNLCRYWGRVRILYEFGYNVYIWDYAGYGLSSGEPSEQGLYADARLVREALETHEDVDSDRIVYYGFSLGGAPAIDLAVDVPPAALITEAAFASGDALLGDFFGLEMAASFVAGEWDNAGKIARVEAPYLVLHGTLDGTVLLHHGEDLFDAANEPKLLAILEGAEHGTVPLVDPDAYADAVTSFIAEFVR